MFHPHCTGSNQAGRRLSEWRHRDNPYYEHAMMCRALENTLYFAGVNYAFTSQESATCIFGPQGDELAHQPYGQAGVLVADIDLARATRHLALRYDASLYAKDVPGSLG